MPAMYFKLARWDSERGKVDIRSSIILSAKVDDSGTIVPMNTEEDVSYLSNEDGLYNAILQTDGKLIFDTDIENEREGALRIYGTPARVGVRVPFVERFAGVPEEEEYEIVIVQSYSLGRPSH